MRTVPRTVTALRHGELRVAVRANRRGWTGPSRQLRRHVFVVQVGVLVRAGAGWARGEVVAGMELLALAAAAGVDGPPRPEPQQRWMKLGGSENVWPRRSSPHCGEPEQGKLGAGTAGGEAWRIDSTCPVGPNIPPLTITATSGCLVQPATNARSLGTSIHIGGQMHVRTNATPPLEAQRTGFQQRAIPRGHLASEDPRAEYQYCLGYPTARSVPDEHARPYAAATSRTMHPGPVTEALGFGNLLQGPVMPMEPPGDKSCNSGMRRPLVPAAVKPSTNPAVGPITKTDTATAQPCKPTSGPENAATRLGVNCGGVAIGKGTIRKGKRRAVWACAQPGCTYVAQSSRHMIRHMTTHSGERPFACKWPGCTYRAKQREHLKTHELKHSSLKSFKCQACGFATKRKEHLKRHIQRHGATHGGAGGTAVL